MTLGLLIVIAALIFLRQFRARRSSTGGFVLAAGGAVAIGAVCAIQLRTTRADNLPVGDNTPAVRRARADHPAVLVHR